MSDTAGRSLVRCPIDHHGGIGRYSLSVTQLLIPRPTAGGDHNRSRATRNEIGFAECDMPHLDQRNQASSSLTYSAFHAGPPTTRAARWSSLEVVTYASLSPGKALLAVLRRRGGQTGGEHHGAAESRITPGTSMHRGRLHRHEMQYSRTTIHHRQHERRAGRGAPSPANSMTKARSIVRCDWWWTALPVGRCRSDAPRRTNGVSAAVHDWPTGMW